jgi:hypothetical protein
MTIQSPPKGDRDIGSGKRLVSFLLAAALSVVYLVLTVCTLLHTARHPDIAAKMEAKDSRQYIEIAHEFAQGDFSMSYVKNMPHRQPLYPLLLAPAVKFWGDDLIKLGSVNILVGLVLLLCLYRGLLGLFASHTVAVLTSLTLIGNPFMLDKIACRLMTEPLHALLLTLLILFFFAYMRTGRSLCLLGVAGMAGLDYLARTNGLFVIAATFGTLGLYDIWRMSRPRAKETRNALIRLRSLLLNYLGAVLVIVIVTTPSWLPRYQYFGNPIHHGYLSNFMWVDNYEEAHTGLPTSDYTWKDYAQSHDFGGFIHRWGEGFYRVYYDIPRHAERFRLLYFLAVIGIVAAFARRRWEYCVLAGFMFVQLLPIVWTSISTPGPRIAYGTMFPFELFFAALSFSYIQSLVTKYISFRASNALQKSL